MKAVMLMFDSLNRRMLEPYGCDWVHTPNFTRLADRAVTFTNCYAGSMPCMPARRELHTGRYNFLHRSWGPLEPFDDSAPEILKNSGVYTHLASDHYHYWEDGGCTYHTRYNSWEAVRGQENDPWKADLRAFEVPVDPCGREEKWVRQNYTNRRYMPEESDHYLARTYSEGMDFLRTNQDADNWFLTVECFDPHEPYFVPQEYLDLYPEDYDGPEWDWPPYARVNEPPEQVRHLRRMSAALHTMCDAYLGKFLDRMDEYNLWDDTLLIVNTDHGFLLGEHGWWAKCVQPFYDEVIHTPLFIWDPRSAKRGERRDQLVQSIDLPATLLEFFGADIPTDMQGVPLAETIASGKPVREAALFGIHGGHVNCTDGRYVYMRAPVHPDNGPLYEYTLMPTQHTLCSFGLEDFKSMELSQPFSFTKGCPTMKIKARSWFDNQQFGTLLFDLENDPQQNQPISDSAIEQAMTRQMVRLMRESDAPKEQFERLGLSIAD